jgi:hypothetical protein
MRTTLPPAIALCALALLTGCDWWQSRREAETSTVRHDTYTVSGQIPTPGGIVPLLLTVKHDSTEDQASKTTATAGAVVDPQAIGAALAIGLRSAVPGLGGVLGAGQPPWYDDAGKLAIGSTALTGLGAALLAWRKAQANRALLDGATAGADVSTAAPPKGTA